MASVTQKLQQFREQQKKMESKEDLLTIKQMSLSQLAQEKIAFGKAKMGKSFPEAFEDASWTDWFVQTYEKSSKPAHQKYIMYVEKRLNQDGKSEAAAQVPIPKTITAPPVEFQSWDEISIAEALAEVDVPSPRVSSMSEMEDQVTSLRMSNENLHQRMTTMEMAVQEMLQHVRNLSIKSEPA